MPASGLLPEPLEDKGGTNASGGDGGKLSLGVRREHQDGLSETCPRSHQGIELAGFLEVIESSESSDDPLPGATVLPAILNDLEVGPRAGGLGAKKHNGFAAG